MYDLYKKDWLSLILEDYVARTMHVLPTVLQELVRYYKTRRNCDSYW